VVTSSRSAKCLTIIARPNHSTTWRANLYALLALSVPSLGAAIAFTALGAWPILPFAGLEMLALATALYYVNWKLQYRHVIMVEEDWVRIDKGHYHPRQRWRFSRRGTGLRITPEQHPRTSPELAVHDRRESVSVGEFLNHEDAHELIALLRGEIRVDTCSVADRRDF